MSVQDERELRERLGTVLDAIETRPAPVTSAMSHGKVIRMRRRGYVAVGLVAVAAAAVLAPRVLHQSRPVAPVAPPHYTVTVAEPAHGQAGVIAICGVNGRSYVARLSGSGADVSASFAPDFAIVALGGQEPSGSDLASFDAETGGAAASAYVGTVAASVQYLTVRLSNGQTLVLRPQPWHGQRYVAMVVPQALAVGTMTAYGRAGEIGYAVPFDYAGMANFQQWLRPGQGGLPRQTVRLASGGVAPSVWSAIAYGGPWGICIEIVTSGGSEGGCSQAPGPPSALVSPFTASGLVSIGFARGDVGYLRLTRSGRPVLQVSTVHADGYTLFAFANVGGTRILDWTAYTADGTRLGSGTGNPAGK